MEEWLYATKINPQFNPFNNLAEYFKEFKQYIKDCEYIGCRHIKEENCGIKNALRKGEISESRYQNFIKIYENLRDKEEHKW